ncbi:UBC core domain-containing protein [Plasmodiophora brassicae]|uniref:UBC core domain-containing protein n=1 Tax=Plasmodiophora brassicae TaxID=37360 RepID=A0A0G4J022_PLABS|nr:hypothetical protein PBRA_001675 [Plasmodiophora brassicae]SPQ93887.1 unnamed protein product [Plasmodiophora brassicae]
MSASLFKIGAGRRAKTKLSDEAAAADAGDGKKKKTAAMMRMMGDMQELDLPDNCKLILPNKDDLMRFSISVKPDAGYWKGATYTFSFEISDHYPYKAPKVKCLEKIWHPNIDLNGAVCLNILRESWRPVLNIQNVVHGLIFLMLDPNPNDPLNQEAAEVMRNDLTRFQQMVAQSLRGGYVQGTQFPRNM